MTKDEKLRKLVQKFFEDYIDVYTKGADGRIRMTVYVTCADNNKRDSLVDLMDEMRMVAEAGIYRRSK